VNTSYAEFFADFNNKKMCLPTSMQFTLARRAFSDRQYRFSLGTEVGEHLLHN
jgi:hypothetical protein